MYSDIISIFSIASLMTQEDEDDGIVNLTKRSSGWNVPIFTPQNYIHYR